MLIDSFNLAPDVWERSEMILDSHTLFHKSLEELLKPHTIWAVNAQIYNAFLKLYDIRRATFSVHTGLAEYYMEANQ